jgi:O-Antigen ligase
MTRNTSSDPLDRLGYLGLWTFVFLIPWSDSVPLVGGFVIDRYIGLLTFGLAFLRIVITGRSRKLSPVHWSLLALVAWSALSFLWTMDVNSTATRSLTYVQLMAAVWLIWEMSPSQERVAGLITAYVVGTCIAAGQTLYNYGIGRSARQVSLEANEKSVNKNRFTVDGLNENDLGLILAISLPLTLYLLTRRKTPLAMALCMAQIGAAIAAILLTGSRGAVIAGAAGMVMLPLIFNRLAYWQRVVCVSAAMLAVAYAGILIPSATWARFADLTTQVTTGDLTHRTVVWAAGLDVFRDHALLGVGSGAYGPAVVKAIDIPYVAHNTFISVLVELGVVGCGLLAAVLAMLFYFAMRMPYLERCLWLSVLLAWGVGVSALTWEYRKPTWLIFGLLAAHAYARVTQPAWRRA